jgi:hypothetical protein
MIIFFLVRSIYKVDHETHWNVAISELHVLQVMFSAWFDPRLEKELQTGHFAGRNRSARASDLWSMRKVVLR